MNPNSHHHQPEQQQGMHPAEKKRLTFKPFKPTKADLTIAALAQNNTPLTPPAAKQPTTPVPTPSPQPSGRSASRPLPWLINGFTTRRISLTSLRLDALYRGACTDKPSVPFAFSNQFTDHDFAMLSLLARLMRDS
jgi:hypothetical protein